MMIVMYLAWDCHCWVHQLQIRNMLCPKFGGVPAQTVFFFGWMVVVGRWDLSYGRPPCPDKLVQFLVMPLLVDLRVLEALNSFIYGIRWVEPKACNVRETRVDPSGWCTQQWSR